MLSEFKFEKDGIVCIPPDPMAAKFGLQDHEQQRRLLCEEKPW